MTKLFRAILAIIFFTSVAHAATLLPNGQQTFTDVNGNPLGGGRVFFYTPSTTTFKNTWRDADQTVVNANPVILDAAGRATIYGSGVYRQVVKDGYGNTVWDQLTSDGASATSGNWGGTSAGLANAQTINVSGFSQSNGQSVSFRAGLTNTAAMTLNVNGLGATPVSQDTLAGPQGLIGGEVRAGNVVTATYDSTLGVFHFINKPFTAPFATLAGSTTTNLGSTGSTNVNITGGATITSFGTAATIANPLYNVVFKGASTVVNSVALGTPNGADFSTTSGDSAVLTYLGSGNWQVLSFTPVSGAVAPGMVSFFNLGACPAGWKPADGTSATADLRGRFPRGLDTSGAVDPGRAVGSYQADQLQTHTHSYVRPTQTVDNLQGNGPLSALQAGNPSTVTTGGAGGTGANVGSETRPKNIALLACQKI